MSSVTPITVERDAVLAELNPDATLPVWEARLADLDVRIKRDKKRAVLAIVRRDVDSVEAAGMQASAVFPIGAVPLVTLDKPRS